MNNDQREIIRGILGTLYDAQSNIESIKDDEECKYDNLPESLQDSSKGESIQEAIDALEDALSYLQDSIDTLEQI